jgi:hypothetical protein
VPAVQTLFPQRFVAERKGKREVLTFYARTPKEGAQMALAWGRSRGYKMYRQKKEA